ncbi:MAG: hypothetical protein KIT02_10295 [Devosia sp.]|uniref:hypothetical protein n=1 Tax=Devosia sp. TaxID=1871048 RepID=UPI0024C58DCC|nr:hypothetical protein [Devosia sp.]UYN98356.1 MAG: hypothetical protein KIT02_10295 [Devosia sp.]
MSTLLDKIRDHAQPDLQRRLEVPEWSMDEGKTPLVIHYRMVTLDDMSTVNDMAKSGALNNIAPYLVALKATDADGKRLFRTADVPWLRENAAPDVLQSIAIQMMGRVSIEEARGN